MSVTMADWERVEALKEKWDRKEERGVSLCVADQPGAVSVHRVKAPSADKDTGGVRYYQCGGGRRVVRKKIGSN